MDNVLLQEYVPRGVDIPFTNYRQRLDLNFKAAVQTVNAHLNQNHTFPEFSFFAFLCLVFSCLVFSPLAFFMVPKFHFSHFQSPPPNDTIADLRRRTFSHITKRYRQTDDRSYYLRDRYSTVG